MSVRFGLNKIMLASAHATWHDFYCLPFTAACGGALISHPNPNQYL